MARKSRKSDAIVFHITVETKGQTVAAIVRSLHEQCSWNEARRLVETRHVQIDGNLCLDSGRRLKTGEVLKLHAVPLGKPPDESDVEIIFLDDDIVIVEKPAGLNSVRHQEERNWSAKRKQFQPTLDELVPLAISLYSGGTFKSRRSKAIYPVHRLDRETSGLMVFARNQNAAASLISQFSDHSIERRYLAIVRGDAPSTTVRNVLVRDRGDGIRGGVSEGDPLAKGGQSAITHFRKLQIAGSYSLVECQLETGRTHQIRIHIAELGFPLCGERRYNGLPGKPAPRDLSNARRVALHAARLGLRHPRTDQPMIFDSPLPEDLRRLWDSLGGSSEGKSREGKRSRIRQKDQRKGKQK